jgi:RES domain-containing protein
VRLIATAHHKPPVLEPLAPSFGARELLESLESVTSGRRVAEQAGIPGLSAEGMAQGYGYTFINAAFAYPRPSGNRFNPSRWGAWYSAFTVNTALHEVAFHLTRALESAGGVYDNTTRYVELFATFDAEFHDLRGLEPPPLCLHPDPAIAYPEGQSLADALRQAGSNGLVYPSCRCPDRGDCLVAFWPGLVREFQRGDTWILTWAGTAQPHIIRAPASV